MKIKNIIILCVIWLRAAKTVAARLVDAILVWGDRLNVDLEIVIARRLYDQEEPGSYDVLLEKHLALFTKENI